MQGNQSTEMDVRISHNSEQTTLSIKPWVRLLSRIFDFVLFALIFQLVFNRLLELELVGTPFMITSLFLWIFVEALLLWIWGTTPGKWILGSSVQCVNSGKITFLQALKRSYSVWWNGMGIGIPYCTLMAATANYYLLINEHSTKWDSWFQTKIVHNPIGVARSLFYVVLIIILIILFLGAAT